MADEADRQDKPQGKKIGWRLVRSDYLFRSRWHNFRRDLVIVPNDEQITYAYLEHPGAAFVVPVTSKNEIILIHSYRYTVDDWCWEIPGGSFGDRAELSAEQVAEQELLEEAGGVAERLESLGWYYIATGVASIKSHYFLGHNVIIGDENHREIGETIDSVKAFPLARIVEMIHSGMISEGESALAIMLALPRLWGNGK